MHPRSGELKSYNAFIAQNPRIVTGTNGISVPGGVPTRRAIFALGNHHTKDRHTDVCGLT